jgi:hypothetical protein
MASVRTTNHRSLPAAGLAAAVLTLALALPAAAHVVGEAGDPNCLGMRVSHGASHSPVHDGHGLTPVERRDLAEQIFGEEIPNIGLWIKFVKTCPAPPDLD